MSDVKRYTMDENSLMGGMDMFEDDDGHYVLHSDYATLLARHNALKEAARTMISDIENHMYCESVDGSKDKLAALVGEEK